MGKTSKRKAAKRNSKNKSGTFKSRLLKWILKLGVLFIAFIALFFFVVYFGLFGPIPTKQQLQRVKNPVASEVFSNDGKLLGRYYIQNRSNVVFEEISPNVINALIATEDARFYEHKGIDEIALLRVLFKSILLRDRSAGGGSTLSQQIAKNLYPRKSWGKLSMPVNKLRESIIAYRLENVYSKEEILSLYLNTVPFGDNTYGIEVASERFFGKRPIDLLPEEAAVIIGMLKANTTYNPRKHPDKSLNRRNTVLAQMMKYGYLSTAEGEAAKKKPLKLNYKVISFNEGPAPYIIESLRPRLEKWCETHLTEEGVPYNLYTDGLKIYTSLDYEMQTYATKAMEKHMSKLQSIFNRHWRNREPWGKKQELVWQTAKQSDSYNRLKKRGVSEEKIEKFFNSQRDVELFTWDGIVEKEMTPLDSVKYYLKLLNTGFMAMQPYTGEVKAYIGGINFQHFKYDHVKAKRQVGSTFKPLVYLSALEQGAKPNDYYPNEQKIYEDYDDWSPRNSHDDYSGFYTMKGALAQSINTIAVDVLLESGIDNTIKLAHKLGVKSDLPEYPSLALGVASISLEEMVCAYSAFVNGGKKIEPYILSRITDDKGEELAVFKNLQSGDPVVEPENTRILIQMLKAVVDEGTAASIRNTYGIRSDFAGKTGTTQNHADGWFIGASPELVAGAWVGADNPAIHFRTITYGQGAYMALPIVGQFYKDIYANNRFRDWRWSSFVEPDMAMMKKLEVPAFKEKVGVESLIDEIGKLIFSKDSSKKQEDSSDAKKEEKKKSKVWEAFKGLFKKKR